MSIADWNQKHIEVVLRINDPGTIPWWNKNVRKTNVGYWRLTTLENKGKNPSVIWCNKRHWEIGKEPQKWLI